MCGLERLRCNLCGRVFTADAPADVGDQKYDATAASMIALLRYGGGFPWNRLETLQGNLGIPLPAATQCEIVTEKAAQLQSAFDELIRQAAQGEVLHNDDTSMRVLGLNRAKADAVDTAPEGTGVFTSGIVSTAAGREIALFFTGRQHAGENLADVLQQRAAELSAPIQMCDALSRNLPKLAAELQIIVGHCLAHSRRRFVELTPNFSEECRFVLESFRMVYANDSVAREQNMTAAQRLAFHQTHSAPVMEELRTWLRAQFDEKRVELWIGRRAITYLLKHRDRLTVSAAARGAAGQQHRGTRAEESDPSQKELFVLQDPEWSTHRRSVHESDPHLRTVRSQSLRLLNRAATACGGVKKQTFLVDAVELPRHIAACGRQRGFQLAVRG